MYTVVLTLHIAICLTMIFFILLQKSKGTEMGAAFGGSSQTIFGSAGATTFLNKLTTVVAVLFMFTCLFLAHNTVPRQKTIMMEQKPITQKAAPQSQKPAGPGSANEQKQAPPASPGSTAPARP
jgi:preprotein translocase subunit SecG